VGTGLVTLGLDAPWSHRMTTTRGTTFTTTMRVIYRVHYHTANGGTNASPALGASLAQGAQTVLTVGNFTDRGAALSVNLTHLTRAQTQSDVLTFFSQNLYCCTSRASQLTAFTRLHFHVVHRGTERDVAQRQCIAGLDRRLRARSDLIASLQTFRRNNVATLTIRILDQRNVRRAVRIILKALYLTGDTVFITTEIDYAILLLVTTTLMTGRDAAVVITATILLLRLCQRSIRSTFVQILTDHLDDKTAARRSRLTLYNRHDSFSLPYSTARKSMS